MVGSAKNFAPGADPRQPRCRSSDIFERLIAHGKRIHFPASILNRVLAVDGVRPRGSRHGRSLGDEPENGACRSTQE